MTWMKSTLARYRRCNLAPAQELADILQAGVEKFQCTQPVVYAAPTAELLARSALGPPRRCSSGGAFGYASVRRSSVVKSSSVPLPRGSRAKSAPPSGGRKRNAEQAFGAGGRRGPKSF